MKLIKDVLCFSKELDFIEQISSDLFENMRCVKQRLAFEFEDYNVSKLIYALNIVDAMIVSIITNEIKDFVELKFLREKILYLITFKHFNEIADEVAVVLFIF